jgi:hypothetical protein
VNPRSNPFGNLFTDCFRPPRPGIDMTMTASLVAFAPDVDLQGLQPRPPKGEVVVRKLLIKTVHAP